MTQTIDLDVDDDAVLELLPLQIVSDGDDYVAGRPGTRRYLALSPAAMEVVARLDGRASLADVRRELQHKYGTEVGPLAPLLDTLLAAGFVGRIDGRAVADGGTPQVPHAPALDASRVAWLFSWPMLTLDAVLLVAAGLIAGTTPAYLPRLADMANIGSYAVWAVVTLAISAIVLAKHEAAHLAAARFLGVHARCRLSHRLFFPVVCTDLTDVRLISRSRRYVVYAAGMVSDLLALAMLIVILWAGDHTPLALSVMAVKVIRLAAFVLAAVLLWQLNIFLRTDLYYILTTALGARNLDADGRRYLRAVTMRLLRRCPAVTARQATAIVRAYALVLVAGAGVWFAIGTVSVLRVVELFRSGSSTWLRPLAGHPPSTPADKAVAVIVLLVTVGLAVYAAITERASAHVQYRLRFTRDV